MLWQLICGLSGVCVLCVRCVRMCVWMLTDATRVDALSATRVTPHTSSQSPPSHSPQGFSTRLLFGVPSHPAQELPSPYRTLHLSIAEISSVFCSLPSFRLSPLVSPLVSLVSRLSSLVSVSRLLFSSSLLLSSCSCFPFPLRPVLQSDNL